MVSGLFYIHKTPSRSLNGGSGLQSPLAYASPPFAFCVPAFLDPRHGLSLPPLMLVVAQNDRQHRLLGHTLARDERRIDEFAALAQREARNIQAQATQGATNPDQR